MKKEKGGMRAWGMKIGGREIMKEYKERRKEKCCVREERRGEDKLRKKREEGRLGK